MIALGAVSATALLLVWWLVRPQSFLIPGASMEPTLQVGDRILASRSYYRRHSPQRGDVVIFRSLRDPQLLRISRVLALGGETIEIVDRKVRINGSSVQDPWGVHGDPTVFRSSQGLDPNRVRRDNLPAALVPEGSVFLLSDNRDFAHDSRFIGPVRVKSLVGRPLLIYYSEKSERIGTEVD